MPRRPRLAIAGVPWHIIQRGVNRSTCFFAEDDYQFYLHYMGEYSRDFGCDIHAYVLMTNRIHLLCGNSRPRVTATPLPHATEAYGQFLGRDFNPLDALLLLRTVRPCLSGGREAQSERTNR